MRSKIGISRRCRKLHVEFAARRSNARCQEKIERYGEQCDDCGVIRHDDIQCYQPTPIPSRIEDRAHFVATIAIAISSSLLKNSGFG
jgi:hypothetical protein